jgi:hypothetical protein
MMREPSWRFAVDRLSLSSRERACHPARPVQPEPEMTFPQADGWEGEAVADWERLWIDLGGEG